MKNLKYFGNFLFETTEIKQKGLNIKRFYYTLLIFAVLVGLLILPTTFSSLTTQIVIKSSGQISVNVVIAKSGLAKDIQDAVNTVNAAGGGTVKIPEGTFYWNGETVNIPGGVNIIGAGPAGCDGYPNFKVYTAKTILKDNVYPSSGDHPMFYIDGSNGKPVRISGIRFEAKAPPNVNAEGRTVAIMAHKVKNLRVDHCTFIDFSGTAVDVSNTVDGTASAVIDHCVIDNPYKLTGQNWVWAYGCYVTGRSYWWNDQTAPITSFLGKYEDIPSGFPVMFVEDCKISRCRHAVDAIQGGWIVARYNYIDHPYPTDYGQLEVHGAGSGSWPSARGFEFYNNIVVGESGEYAELTWLRGGGGVVFNNTFIMSEGYAIGLYRENCPQQPDEVLHNVWIWDNTVSGGTLIHNAGNFQLNVDYFLRTPNQQQDGFTYKPYPYPHPLTSE